MDNYGFDFGTINALGFGDIMNELMMALHVARGNDMNLVLVLDESSDTLKDFNYYFKSFEVVSKSKIKKIYPQLPDGWRPPADRQPIAYYGQLAREIFQLHADIEKEITSLVAETQFNPETDLVVAIESATLPLDEYVQYTVDLINKKYSDRKDLRVYLITYNNNIIDDIRAQFAKHNITVLCHKFADIPYMKQKLTELWIMKSGLHLVGGRESTFFRMGELLRYPLATLNIKDSDVLPEAPYGATEEFLVNPIYQDRYINFVSEEYLLQQPELVKTLEGDYIVSVANFMNQESAAILLDDMGEFTDYFWYQAINPGVNGGTVYLMNDDPELENNVVTAELAADEGHFAYHFRRTIGDHYSDCECYSCKLESTFCSYEVLKALSNIVGKRVLGMNEIFAAKYDGGDFLTVHHDVGNGDYAFILELTPEWSPTYGGITHFYDTESKEIYRSIHPKFNQLLIVKLSPERPMDRFMSNVVAPKSRYVFTGWFTVAQ